MRSRSVAIAAVTALTGAVLTSGIAGADPLITPHDNFEDAKIVGSLPYEDRMPTAFQATNQADEPLCRTTATKTVWYRYTPVTDQVVDLERGGSPSIVALGVYLGDDLGSLSQVACGSTSVPVSFLARAGVTHHIQVGVSHALEVIFQAFAGTAIKGRITDQTGAPVPGACVWAYHYNGEYYSGQTITNADGDGRYHLVGLVTGSHALQFGCFDGLWKYEFYNDKPLFSQVDHVSYSRGTDLVIDAELTRRSSISGTLADLEGNPVATCVNVRSPAGYYFGSDNSSAEDGSYTVPVTPGDYVLQFGCTYGSPWAIEFYNDVHDISSAQVIALPELTDLAGFDASLERRGRVSGRILGPQGETIPTYQCARLYPVGNPNSIADISNMEEEGTYELFAEAGSYKLFFSQCWGDTPYVAEWYENQADFASATSITIANGDEIVIDALLGRIGPPPNDDLANAEEIDSIPFTKTAMLISATREQGEPTTCSSSGGTAWYRFTPSQETDLVLTLGDRYAEVGVFVENANGELSQVSCGNYFTYSNSGFVAEAGTTYFIQVARGSTVSSTFKGERLLGVTTTNINAPLPCAFACPYWQNTGAEANAEEACAPEPTTVPGSFHDTQVTVPSEIDGRVPTHLLFHVAPEIDYDLWICRTVPDAAGKYYLAHGANAVGEGCPDVPVACRENAFARIEPGETYILRAYNWSDQSTTPGLYGYASLP